ncbi:hypothetical protein [Metabacillus fastidiosus]|uniref:Uncharacterized protein n=1 Tax=Metabacillus fastidiosus TaxID=1458 RepID=A0ABU6NRQ1_9BACI|nr:hypothetical protein [Metabacillus fastidiosus]
MLSEKGLRYRLDGIEHETKMHEFYKSESSKSLIKIHKEVVIESFKQQQKLIKRYESVLKEIASKDEKLDGIETVIELADSALVD